jgi:hypothetical protein
MDAHLQRPFSSSSIRQQAAASVASSRTAAAAAASMASNKRVGVSRVSGGTGLLMRSQTQYQQKDHSEGGALSKGSASRAAAATIAASLAASSLQQTLLSSVHPLRSARSSDGTSPSVDASGSSSDGVQVRGQMLGMPPTGGTPKQNLKRSVTSAAASSAAPLRGQRAGASSSSHASASTKSKAVPPTRMH